MGVVIELPTHAEARTRPVHGFSELAGSTRHEIDAAVGALAARRRAWRALGVAGRVELLDQVIADTADVAHRWVAAECERKRIAWGSPAAGEEWALGPWSALRGLRLLRSTLKEIERHGHPRLPAGRASMRCCPRIADLRYGTIVINGPAFLGLFCESAPWGAFPGHRPIDIQSGRGYVHNSYVLTRHEKTVIQAPFQPVPHPPWLVTHPDSQHALRHLTLFEAAPKPARLPAILWHSLKR